MASGRPRHICRLRAGGRRLTGAICLHYAGLFGEASNGVLSWLREGLIYRQARFEALFTAVAVRSGAGRPAALGAPA